MEQKTVFGGPVVKEIVVALSEPAWEVLQEFTGGRKEPHNTINFMLMALGGKLYEKERQNDGDKE